MVSTIKKRITKQRSLKHFNGFKPIVEYFDKISPDIKKLPKFKNNAR